MTVAMRPPRRTLDREAVIAGVGLFSARAATARILPGESGIAFRRTDLAGSPEVPALVAFVSSAAGPLGPPRNTSLARGQATVATTEHILSALAGLAITDAIVEIDGPEVPIVDGSAAPFVNAIRAAGVRELADGIDPLIVTREVSAGDARASIVARPWPGARFEYILDYGPDAPIPPQRASIDLPGAYADSVAPARTFCLRQEAEAMRAAGLFRHLSPSDMLVIGESGPIENAYRFPDEPARHKLLDLIGDLALVGRPIRGHVVAMRGGHTLNHAMARALAR